MNPLHPETGPTEKAARVYELPEEEGLLSTEELKIRVKQAVVARLRSPDLRIPMLPHVALHVMKIAGDSTSNAADLARVLKQDQQLAGKLIAVANSPVYAGISQFTTVERAVTQVGMKTVRDLVMGVALGTSLFRSRAFGGLMEGAWIHSLAVGHIATELARSVGVEGDGFLAGLMHDVGKALLVDILVDVQRAEKGKLVLSLELVREILDEYHQPVGGLIARKWNFPPVLLDAVQFHHRYAQAKNGGTRVANLVCAADLLHYHLGILCPQREIDPATHPCFQDLGLAPDKLAAFIEQLVVNLPIFLAHFVP